jgi:hypothetical protein
MTGIIPRGQESSVPLQVFKEVSPPVAEAPGWNLAKVGQFLEGFHVNSEVSCRRFWAEQGLIWNLNQSDCFADHRSL